MTVLAIDTADRLCAVALLDPASGTVLAQRSPEIGKGHAEILLPLIEEVLAEAGIAYRAITRIVASTGPGSFTGIRVGLAAARGMALALGVPAIGISSLQALATHAGELSAETVSQPLLVAMDAFRGETYAQIFGACDSEPFVASTADVARIAADSGVIALSGDGADAIAADSAFSSAPAFIVHRLRIAPVEVYARIGIASRVENRPEPLYLRPPDAKPQTRFAVQLAVSPR